MTLPRRILEHATYMITRRCSERRYLLRPDPEVTQTVAYLIAVQAKRHGIQILAWTVLSNHYHAILADPHGNLPKFMEALNSLIARALNALRGRGENFFAPGSYNAVELDPIEDEQNLIEKLAYVWSNPVAAGLVERPERWPGLITLPEDMGTRSDYRERPQEAFFGGKRPEGWEPPRAETRRERLDRLTKRRIPRRDAQPRRAAYKRKPSTLPEGAVFVVSLPAHVTDAEDFRKRCREALEARLQEIHQQRAAEGRTQFLGAKGVLDQDFLDAAGDTIPDFGLDPALAPGRDEEARKAKIQALQEWRTAYQLALGHWREGKRAVSFPLGTYKLRVLHGARVVTDDPALEAA